jgi:hypothetical protein
MTGRKRIAALYGVSLIAEHRLTVLAEKSAKLSYGHC